MHTDASEAASIARIKFQEIRAQDILPEELIGLVERVLPLQLGAMDQARVLLPAPEACASATAMFAGSPLLTRAQFPSDVDLAKSLAPKLLDALALCGGDAATAASALSLALNSGELDLIQALDALAAGDDAIFAAWRERLPGTPRALEFLAVSSLAPGLWVAAEKLAPRLPENLPHEHGHCPLCGSLPYISVLREKEGKRNAECSYCGFEYRIRRIACPYCDEDDQNKLKLFRVAEYPGLRVDVCDTCSMYVKTVDFREMDRKALPALDDMATLALDMLAQRQGYKRPTLSAWGF